MSKIYLDWEALLATMAFGITFIFVGFIGIIYCQRLTFVTPIGFIVSYGFLFSGIVMLLFSLGYIIINTKEKGVKQK